MRRPAKRLILVGLSLSVLVEFVWTIHSQQSTRATAPRAKDAPTTPALPVSEKAVPASTPAEASAADAPVAPPPAAPTAPAAAPAPAPAPAVETRFADFRAWTAESIAPGAKSGDFLARGVTLAKARRAALAQLIVEDPERALAEAVPPLVRQQLPAEILSQLEDRVSTRADYSVLATLPPEGSSTQFVPAIIRQVVTPDGTRYDAYVYGTRVRQPTATSLPLHGIALDGKLAVAESAVRVVAVGEKIAASTPVVETCPISGDSVPAAHAGVVPADANALEIGGTIHFFCGAGHLAEVIQGIRSGKFAVPGDSTGVSSGGAVAQSSYNQGIKNLLIIRCNFTDALAESISVAGGQTMLSQTDAFMNENSYGTLRIDLVNSLVTPVLITMPKTKAQYATENNPGGFLSDARTAAAAAGYNYAAYDFEFVCFASVYGGWSGQAFVGSRGVWLQSNSTGVAVHEWGHNLGLWHANFWTASNDTVIGAGSNGEYGDSFDTMGAASAGRNSFNACHRNILGWLPNTNVQTATAAGATYRVYAFDQTTLNANQTLAVTTTKDATRTYWLEHRVQWSSLPNFANGVLLHWGPWASSNGGSQLLDVTPGTPSGKNDSAIVLGRTFSDVAAGVHITTISKNSTTPESMDVVINRGTFPNNRPPTLSVGASATSVAVNTAVNFTATATDPDGDTVAYYWDFGNGAIGPNSPNASAQWSSAGDYNVVCIVSDMKGGTTTQTKLVTVGTPTTFTASGVVTDNYGQLMEGVRVHNNLSGGSYRGTYTDSAGQYTLTNLAAGSYTLGAVSALFTTSAVAGFANPITVGPSQSNLNFTGTSPGAFITVSPPALPAKEAGQVPASFTFTRGQEVPATGTQTINFTLTGTADKATDYAVTPGAPATGTYNSSTGVGTLTFPAGALNATLKITPIDDAIAEGTETVLATVTTGTGYQLGGTTVAALMIDDNDFQDVYTESFSSAAATLYPFDRDGKTVTFTPTSATSYQGNTDPASAFPTDPTGGTILVNNGAAVVPVTSGSVQFGYWQLTGLLVQPKMFGTTYSQIFVNTAGNVTFESGDTNGDSTPSQHFTSGRKRVSLSGNYMDLSKGGTISYKVITTPGVQRVVVTYVNVPRYYSPASVLNAQVELWANGRITLTWVGTTISDGVSGLAAGQAAPSPFLASDLSAYPPTIANFTGWQNANFTPAELADSNISGWNADPDGDGWSNLMEYALGSDPHARGTPPGAPVPGQAGGYLTITFQRNPLLTDLNYIVEAGDMSGGWTVIAQSLAGATTSAASGQAPSQVTETPVVSVMNVTVGDTVLMSGQSQRFLRLRVTKP